MKRKKKQVKNKLLVHFLLIPRDLRIPYYTQHLGFEVITIIKELYYSFRIQQSKITYSNFLLYIKGWNCEIIRYKISRAALFPQSAEEWL